MGKQIMNLQTFELRDMLKNIESLPDETVFVQGEIPFNDDSICVIVTDEHDDDMIHKLFELGFYESLEISIIKRIKRIAKTQLTTLSEEQLLKGFNYYLINDGFYLFDGSDREVSDGYS